MWIGAGAVFRRKVRQAAVQVGSPNKNLGFGQQ